MCYHCQKIRKQQPHKVIRCTVTSCYITVHTIVTIKPNIIIVFTLQVFCISCEHLETSLSWKYIYLPLRPGFKNSSIFGPNSILLVYSKFAYLRYPWGVTSNICLHSNQLGYHVLSLPWLRLKPPPRTPHPFQLYEIVPLGFVSHM